VTITSINGENHPANGNKESEKKGAKKHLNEENETVFVPQES
jgi:hypothetical protein